MMFAMEYIGYMHRVRDGREYLLKCDDGILLVQRDPETQAGFHPSILSIGILRFPERPEVNLTGVYA